MICKMFFQLILVIKQGLIFHVDWWKKETDIGTKREVGTKGTTLVLSGSLHQIRYVYGQTVSSLDSHHQDTFCKRSVCTITRKINS